MANGIKLRRGLKASLMPPVEGELTYAIDTNEIVSAFNDGTTWKAPSRIVL